MDLTPKLLGLKNFLTNSNSEESINYISDLLSGETARPEELFVQKFLNAEFWKELGYLDSELKFERPAGVHGRVEWTLKIDDKLIAIECKRPYFIKNEKEVKNELDGNDIDELKDQIGPYLLSHPFIIFTNGFHWYFYSRESYRAWLINKNKKDSSLNPYFKHLTVEEIFDENSVDFILNILPRKNILESLSSFEHKSIRHILTDEFFTDLRTWVGYVDTALKDVPADTKARTTALINKLIFVRTMEGVGIIPNEFLASIWNEKKGISKSTVKFIDNIDDELSEIYDTELFTSQYLEGKEGEVILKNGLPEFNPKRAKNYAYSVLPEEFFSAILKDVSELNLGDTGKTKLTLNEKTFYIRSIYWWKFESISADILGKAYETYLARERKKLGIYYTPSQMTEYLTTNTINSTFDKKIEKLKSELNLKDWNVEEIKSIANDLVNIKICDPTCGSGSFLIQSIRIVWKKYKEINKLITQKDEEISKNKQTIEDFANEKFGILESLRSVFRTKDKQERMGTLILRHIYGNDKDVKAADTAKLNVWLECIRLDPNSYRKDSLKGKRHVLPNLELNITSGDSFVGVDIETMSEITSGMSDTIKSIHSLREQYIQNFDRTMLASYAAEMRDGLQGLGNSNMMTEMGLEKTEKLLKIATPTNWSIQHITAFYDKDGNLLPKEKRGFDVIIGNPPWEVLKPNIDEFCAPIYEEKFDKKFTTLEKKEKDKFLEEILKNSFYKLQWDKYNEDIAILSEYFNKSKFYNYQKPDSKAFGELNLYRIFLEKAYSLLKKDGICGVVIPSNLYSDANTKKLRELLFQKAKVLSIFSFDNKNGIFEDIHRQWKFMTFVFQKSGKTDKFKAKFFLRDIESLSNIEENYFIYDFDLMVRTSPTTLSIVECSNQLEVNIIEKLYLHPLLISDEKWHMSFAQGDFNSSSHASFFNTQKKGVVLYEGKMIHQFTNTFGEPRYWLEWEPAIKKLASAEQKKINSQIKKTNNSKKEIKSPPLQFQHESYRLAWRHVSRSTDTRTMICTILPPNTFQSDSLYFIKPIYFDGIKYQKSISTKETLYLCGVLNSFVIDFIIRHRVSINISTFFVHELPIPRIDESNLYFNEIVRLTGELICTTNDFDNLKTELGIKNQINDSDERQNSIAKINAYAAKIYDFSKEELEYVLSTFTSVNNEIKEKIMIEFERLT